jgi:4-hydroxymandelate oxidase
MELPHRALSPAAGSQTAAGVTSGQAFNPVDIPDYARVAPARMSTIAWEYIRGGAADERTLRWNQEAFQKLQLRPRTLVDVSKLDLRVTLFGQELPHPIILAPAAYQKLMHPEGEIASIKGAGAARAAFVISTTATTTIEDIAAAATSPVWFQLYMQRDREVARALMQRAEAAGCQVLVLTVDTPVLGPRYRETRTKFTLPPGVERANLKGLTTAFGAQRASESTIYTGVQDPTLAWKDLEWVRSVTKLPLVLKGMLDPADAARAVEAGVQGVIVSNHGARNVDTVPAAIDALPDVVEQVRGRIPVLVDGGIRRGTDVLKALALGASAVLIGRPYLYGLAVNGAAGVTHVVNILRRELEMAMASTGRPTLSSLDASVIWR